MINNVLICWDATHNGLRTLSRVLDDLSFKKGICISHVLYIYCEYMYHNDYLDETKQTSKERIDFLNNINNYKVDEDKALLLKKFHLGETSEKETAVFSKMLRTDKILYYQSNIALCHSDTKIETVMIPENYIHKENGDSYIEIGKAVEAIILPKLPILNPTHLHISLDSGTQAMKSTFITLHSQSVFNAYIGDSISLWAFSDEALQSKGRRFKDSEQLKKQEIKQNPYIASIEKKNFALKKFSHINLDTTGMIIKTATINAPFLLLGERGTGKSFMIQEIFETKKREGIIKENGTCRTVICGTLTGELVDDKLFGHWKGAYTGAEEDAPGEFELCNGGLLFLDEIQDIPKSTQRKILRALNEGIITRQGHSKNNKAEEIKVVFSLVCASNKSLKELQESGKLDPDFLDRIARFICEMKPLRELDEYTLKEIWNTRWQASIIEDNYLLPNEPDNFEIVKDFLIESKMLGNIRDINQLIAYIARDVYEGVPTISENKKKERYPRVLKQWFEDYNKKYSDFIYNNSTLTKRMLETYGWDGMEKLFKHWLSNYAKKLYGSDLEAANNLNTTDRTLRGARRT